MKTFLPITITSSVFLVLLVAGSFAMEREGLRVDVVPKMLVDKSLTPNTMATTTPVDEEMSLKATIKNVSMKDVPESTIDYVVLVQRWATETGAYSSYKGTQKLQPIRFADQVEVDIGKYHIGGHLHAAGEQHKDKLAGWKIVITEPGKTIEFTSGPNFEGLNVRAKPAHDHR